jgi:hypothetical protein
MLIFQKLGLGLGLYSGTTPSPEVGPAPRHSAVSPHQKPSFELQKTLVSFIYTSGYVEFVF